MKTAVFLMVFAAGFLPAQGLSQPPRVVQRTMPEYTQEALKAKVEGDVVLTTTIQTDGTPGDIKVTRGLGNGLDEKAIDCLKQWRFSPGSRNGKPVAVKATVEIRFRLPPALSR
jgi:periplasmic protein TonB